MATAASGRKLYVKSTSSAPSSGDEVDGAIDFKVTRKRTVLNTTDFKGSSATPVQTKMLGLKDGDATIGGDWEQADAPQALLRTVHDSGATVYVTDLPDGTNGYTYPVLVSDIEENGTPDGKNQATFTLTFNGDKIARP